MKFAVVLVVAVIAVSAVSAGYPNQIDKGKLKFRLAGRQLADKDDGFGTSDPVSRIYNM